MRLFARRQDDDSVRLHRRTLREIIAPLSARERLVYGFVLIFLAYVLFSSISSAADKRFGTVVRIPARQCLSDESWSNPSLASGQQYSAVGSLETAVVPVSDYAAISSERIGQLVCSEFEAIDDIKVSQSLSVYLSSVDPNSQSLSDGVADMSLVSPDFSISESSSRETFIEPLVGGPEQQFGLDGVVMVEIATAGSAEWDLIAILSANQLSAEMTEINIGLPMKYQLELADLQFRFTPLQAGDQSPLIAIDSVAISYLVGANKATELRAISSVATSEDAEWVLDPNGDFDVELVVDDPNISLLGGFSRELMDIVNDPEEPATQTTFELIDRDAGTSLPIIAKSSEWQGRNIDGTSVWQFGLEIPQDLTIGEYALQATTVFEDGTITTTRQDFIWGVLALNTNKTVYQVSETADIMMTVLDPIGATDCQADLVLTVQSATNTTIFRTSDGSIIKNDSCYEYSSQISPDYQTQYYFQETGVYILTLQATTASGTYSTSDSIEVMESVPINIERTGPTRIYPIVDYPMLLNITATEAFSGKLTESLPGVFIVSQISADNQFTLTADPNANQLLTWDIQLDAGQSISVGYGFDAPNVSPEFYLLGKATLMDTGALVVFEEARYWQLASDATADTIDSSILDATDEFAPSPSVVFTDAQTGYAFYIDATSQDWAYSKTTNGGATWGAAVVINTARAWTSTAVWYDRWTPGDNSGNLIHIFATEDGTDDGYYTYLDTSTDTLRAAPVLALSATAIAEAADGPPSITKGASGYLFVTMNSSGGVVGGQVAKSTNGGTNWVVNTPASWSSAAIDQVQLVPLLTDNDILAIKVDTAANTIDSRVYDEVTDTWDGAWTNIATLTENITYDQWFAATIKKSTGNVYLSFANATGVAGNDIMFYSYSDSVRSWTAKTNLFTDNTTVMMPAPVMDEVTGTITVAYLQGTLGADMDVFTKYSSDYGTTWSSASAPLSSVTDDHKALRSNFLYYDLGYVAWYNDDTNALVGSDLASYSLGEQTIDSTVFDSTDEFSPSPSVVFTDSLNGYAFYIDATSQDWAYSKTTNGGATWGAAVVINTARAWTKISVWYDQWTPGDTTGSLIHIIATEDGTDDGYYTYLNTATDALRAAPVLALSGGTINEASSGGPSIAKGVGGYLFVTMNTAAGPVGGQISKSTNGGTNWVSITPASWSGADADQVQLLPLLTDSDIIAVKANTVANTIDSRVYDEVTDTWDGAWTNIATLTENITYDRWFAATIKKSTGNVYLSFANATGVAGNDIMFYSYSDSVRSWTAKTNLFTDNTTVMMPAPVMDEVTGTIYTAYLRGSLGGTMHVYYKVSSDGGTTWSAEQGRINNIGDDHKELRTNLLNDLRLYAVWHNDDLDDLVGATIIEFKPTLAQSGFRLFANADSTDVGVPLAAQNNSFTLINAGDSFRIRMLVDVSQRPLRSSGRDFKLQFAGKGAGTCANPSGTPSSYRSVTDSTAISFLNNSPSDGAALTTNLNDPAHGSHTTRPQTYEESNNLTNSVSSIAIDEDGMWDFALYDNGAPGSTSYCFRLIYSDGSALDSYAYYPEVRTITPNAAPDSPSSLAQKKTDDTTLSIGSWTDESSIKFEAQASDPNNPDNLQLCVEADALGTAFSNTEDSCGAATLYSGTPLALAHTLSSFSHGTSYHWQVRLKDTAGAYSSWVSYGGNPENEADFRIDLNDPTGTVYDGTSAGVDVELNDGSLDELSANWSITDSNSGVANFDYSIGTIVGGTDVAGWTDVDLATSVTASSLSLRTGVLYYFNIRATDTAGNAAVISSDGQIVAPTLSFSTSPGSVSFGELSYSNNYTAEEEVTVTTSTNAYGGYVIRAMATGILENESLATIGFFNGGTYLSPDGWMPGDIGYGYTSSDNLVQGSNIFHPLTCLGGNASPCYVPFSTLPPGDIVADNPGPVIGTAISDEDFIITHRVVTTSLQELGVYTTEVIYSAIPIY